MRTSMRRNKLATGWRASSASIAGASPTSSSPTWRCRAATSAPSTMTDGPASPPMASIGMPKLFFDRLDLAPAVVAAVGADLVRKLRFVALRTLAAADRLQRVVRAALGRAGLRVPAFRIRHDGLSLLFVNFARWGPFNVPHLAARSRPFGLPSGARLPCGCRRLLFVQLRAELVQCGQPWIGPLW